MKSYGLYRSCLSIINSKRNEIFSLLSNSINTNGRKISHSFSAECVCTTQHVVHTRSPWCYLHKVGLLRTQDRAVIHTPALEPTGSSRELLALLSIEMHSQLVSRQNAIVFYGFLKIIFECCIVCDRLHTLSYKNTHTYTHTHTHTHKSYLFSSIQT